MRLLPPALLSALLVLFAACSGSELVGVHVALQKDGSGLVTIRALVESTGQSPAEVRSQGVAWTTRASLVCSQGTFQQIQDLKLGDGGLRFVSQLGDDRPALRIYVQRGPAAAWVRSLVPEQQVRRVMAKVYDPTGRTTEIGDTLRLEVALPTDVVTSGVLPGGRGIEAGREGKRAFLLIPVRTALEAGDELVWDVSWR